MTAMVEARPDTHTDIRSLEPRLLLDMVIAQDRCVVRVAGELDLATRNQLVSAATAGHHPRMVIDLGGLTFMDCSGYRAVLAARRIIEGEGRSLMIRGQTGQPARFLELIAELENGPQRLD